MRASHWFFWIPGRGGLQFKQAAITIEFAYSIDVAKEIVSIGKLPNEFDLHVRRWPADLDTIVLCQPLEQLHALPEHPFPTMPVPDPHYYGRLWDRI